MSEYLAAAAQVLSAPEVLVKRSAEARAKATGADVDAILQAWAGGEAIAAVPQAAPAAPAEAAPEPVAASAPAEAPAPQASQAVETVPAPVAVAVIERAVEEPVVAAPLSDRIRVASRAGAVAGAAAAILGLVFSSQFMITRAGVAGEGESLSAVLGIDPGGLVLTGILISIAIGMAVAGLARLIPSWTSPGMKLTGSALPSIALGAIVGAVVGAIAGGIIAGSGTPPELPDDPTNVSVAGAVIWSLLAWAAGGWVIGALVQALGVPAGVEDVDAEEVATVRGRLVAAFGLPAVAAIAILIMVLSFAFVFISFPSWSPLTGTIIAGSILGFAALSASRPNMKVGLEELLVAAAGIGVVVVLVYAVLQTTGAGEHHGDEESADHSSEEAPAEGEALISVVL